MNKGKEKAIHDIIESNKQLPSLSYKSVARFINRMEPMSDMMRSYFQVYYGAKSHEERLHIRASYVSKMSISEQKAFENEHFECLQKEIMSHNAVPQTA